MPNKADHLEALVAKRNSAVQALTAITAQPGMKYAPEHLEELYAKREEAVQTTAALGVIQAHDIYPLDKLARFAVASQHWGLCDTSARNALLNDQSHQVRGCASCMAQRAGH